MNYRRLTGTQTIRIFSKPFQMLAYCQDNRLMVKDPTIRVENLRTTRRWMLDAILRNENRASMIDIGPVFFSKVRDGFRASHLSDPIAVDINVDVDVGSMTMTDIPNVRNAMDTDIMRAQSLTVEKFFTKNKHGHPEFEIELPEHYRRESDFANSDEGYEDFKLKNHQFDIYEVTPDPNMNYSTSQLSVNDSDDFSFPAD